MKAVINEAILMEGEISSVSFTPKKDKALVEFEGEGKFVFEFSNAKRPRADHVKKLRLHAGDRVIAIGAKSRASALHGFGYDIMRDGRVAEDSCALICGTAEKLIAAGKHGLACIRTEDGRSYMVYCDGDDLRGAETGCRIACLCHVIEEPACEGGCCDYSAKACGTCSKRKNRKKYIAYKTEINGGTAHEF